MQQLQHGKQRWAVRCCSSKETESCKTLPGLMQKLSVLILLQVYKPIVEAVSRRLDAAFNVTDSIFGSQQSHATVAAVSSYLEGTF